MMSTTPLAVSSVAVVVGELDYATKSKAPIRGLSFAGDFSQSID